MGLSQIKKINNNIARPLNEFFNSMWDRVDTRRYFYNDCYWDHDTRSYINAGNYNSTRTYTIPMNGYYTIRAYTKALGVYGKIIGRFRKGEQLSIEINSAFSINIFSANRTLKEFQIYLSSGVANVNGTSSDFIAALAIGGSGADTSGGWAYVRCNNGIAVGGGGGCSDPNSTGGWVYGYNGGTAYAWGNNVYALGGGGGAANSSSSIHEGGNAFVNDEEITTYCSYNNTQPLRSGRGYPGDKYYGGNGGTGGGSSYSYAARGYYSNGGQYTGASARGGSNNEYGNGYFEGGKMNYRGYTAGRGGFYGGEAYNDNSSGGIGTYGFGGGSSKYYGGDGQLKGGDGRYGGNGLKPGVGNVRNGNAIRHKSIIHTLPAWNKFGSSIVIVEYGISKDNY